MQTKIKRNITLWEFKDMNNVDPIEFALKSIRTDEFAVIQDSWNSKAKTRLGSGFGFGIDKDSKEITVSFRISFESDTKPFILLQISCTYMIKPEDFNKFPVKDDLTVEVRKDFVSHLAFLTVGTARGVLYAKLENTQFNNYFLPIIDVSNVVVSDMSLKPALST
jgi:hypothetical protein